MLQNVTKCYKMLQNVAKCYKMLQNVAKCYKILSIGDFLQTINNSVFLN